MELIEKDLYDPLMSRFYIDPSVKENIIFVGWDMPNFKQEAGIIPLNYKLLQWSYREHEEYKKKIKKILFEKCPDLFREKTDDMHDTLLHLSIEDLKKIDILMKEFNAVCKYQKAVCKELKVGPLTEERLRKAYPKRTANMAKTLVELNKMLLKNRIKAKIVLTTGSSHLEVEEKDKEIEEYQLDELYKVLAKMNAVVMIPHITDAHELKKSDVVKYLAKLGFSKNLIQDFLKSV